MPQDWRSLFDTSLFSMDTRLVPQVSKMQLGVVRRTRCTARPCTARPIHAIERHMGPQVCAESIGMLNLNAVKEDADLPSPHITSSELRLHPETVQRLVILCRGLHLAQSCILMLTNSLLLSPVDRRCQPTSANQL